MARMSKTQRGERYKSLLRGMRRHYTDAQGLRDQPLGKADMERMLQRLLDAFKETDVAWASYKSALAKRRKLEREASPLVKRLVEWAYVVCTDEEREVDFDLPPPRPKGPQTVESKARMVQSRKKRKAQ